MATAHVQDARATGALVGTSIAVAFGSDVTAGNLIAVWASWDLGIEGLGANVTGTAADSLGNTYSAVVDTADSTGQDPNWRGATFYAVNILGGANTVTVSLSGLGGPHRGIIVHEVSGADTTSPLSAHAAQFQSAPGTGTNAVSSGAATPDADGCYVFGGTEGNTGGSDDLVSGTGFTQEQAFGGNLVPVSEYLIQATAASIAATFTLVGGGNNMVTAMMAFKPAGGGGGATAWGPLLALQNNRLVTM